jgi:hypothetical protein
VIASRHSRTLIQNAGAERIDPADNLVARDDRHNGIGQFAIDDVQIGTTDTAGQDLDSNLARSWITIRNLGPFQRRSELFQDHCLHDVLRIRENQQLL